MSGGVRLRLAFAVAAVLAGCTGQFPLQFPGSPATPVSAQSAVPPISGRVDFGPDRRPQATMGDIARAATVSLIDAGTNETKATTWTDAGGAFNLAFPNNFVPIAGAVYILEGIKGLGENLPGNNTARVRTLARFTSGAWDTITAGVVTINPSTTALAIMEASYQAAGKPGARSDPQRYIGLVSQTSDQAGVPDTLAGGQTVVTEATFVTIYGYVAQAVLQNVDPVASVQYNGIADSFVPVNLNASLPNILGFFPPAAVRGAEVTLFGANFETVLGSNEVYVAGYRATVTQATRNTLVFKVPGQAVTGDLQVVTPGGSSNKVSFAVYPDPGGYFEP